MLSKEEIESTLNKCDTCNLKECINCEISYTEIQRIKEYIQQLETREQKLIEMLEERITTKNIRGEMTKTEKILYGDIIQKIKEQTVRIVNEYRKEILKILKGEN